MIHNHTLPVFLQDGSSCWISESCLIASLAFQEFISSMFRPFPKHFIWREGAGNKPLSLLPQPEPTSDNHLRNGVSLAHRQFFNGCYAITKWQLSSRSKWRLIFFKWQSYYSKVQFSKDKHPLDPVIMISSAGKNSRALPHLSIYSWKGCNWSSKKNSWRSQERKEENGQRAP